MATDSQQPVAIREVTIHEGDGARIPGAGVITGWGLRHLVVGCGINGGSGGVYCDIERGY